CQQILDFALAWARRYLVRELDQLIGHACHCRDHRDDLGTFALRFDKTTRHITDSLRCSDGSTTVFLNNQAHVRCTLNRRKREPRRFLGKCAEPCPTANRCSSRARRTASRVAATGLNSLMRSIITSGSFNPCPVTVQTIRLPSGIFLNEYAASFESQHLKSPAIAAALAGSAKIPSCRASHFCAARISSSVTMSIAPRDSLMAAHACFQLAGLPIRIADAIVSGFSTVRL